MEIKWLAFKECIELYLSDELIIYLIGRARNRSI